jgi:hypothetical protein
MKHVELQRRHLVDGLLERLDRLIMSRDVGHVAAPAVSRAVLDPERRNLDRLAERVIGAEQLGERHGAVQEARVA